MTDVVFQKISGTILSLSESDFRTFLVCRRFTKFLPKFLFHLFPLGKPPLRRPRQIRFLRRLRLRSIQQQPLSQFMR